MARHLSGAARGTEVTTGLVAALIICGCLAIRLGERTFDCQRDALLISDGEIVAIEDHACHTMRLDQDGGYRHSGSATQQQVGDGVGQMSIAIGERANSCEHCGREEKMIERDELTDQ
jgi:hypothetical protein